MALTISGSGGGVPVGVPTVETGSYTGDGTRTRSIQFTRKPVFVVIHCDDYNCGSGIINCTGLTSSMKTGGYTYFSTQYVVTYTYAKLENNTKLTFGVPDNQRLDYALNTSNKVYHYVAFTI